MVIREQVKQAISTLPDGVVVAASDFDVPRQYRATLIKALNQFEQVGILKRASKGRYYKPRQSQFGELLPSEYEIVKDFLEKDGKTVGYITGTRAFAGLGLTTQISSDILIGTNVSRRPLVRGQYRISFLLQPNTILKDDIPFLIVLDALRLVKEIPATTPNDVIAQVLAWMKTYSSSDLQKLLNLSMRYKPYVRAQLGAILDCIGFPSSQLLETLNPVSRYKLGITSVSLSTSTNWNIV